jgi:hypothetical protein
MVPRCPNLEYTGKGSPDTDTYTLRVVAAGVPPCWN